MPNKVEILKNIFFSTVKGISDRDISDSVIDSAWKSLCKYSSFIDSDEKQDYMLERFDFLEKLYHHDAQVVLTVWCSFIDDVNAVSNLFISNLGIDYELVFEANWNLDALKQKEPLKGIFNKSILEQQNFMLDMEYILSDDPKKEDLILPSLENIEDLLDNSDFRSDFFKNLFICEIYNLYTNIFLELEKIKKPKPSV